MDEWQLSFCTTGVEWISELERRCKGYLINCSVSPHTRVVSPQCLLLVVLRWVKACIRCSDVPAWALGGCVDEWQLSFCTTGVEWISELERRCKGYLINCSVSP